MDLLSNAVEAVQVGVEDYQQGTERRLRSAVRNIHAGILLLYKEALRRASPDGSDEALLKSRILPERDGKGDVQFVGDGRKTVDIQQIKERFASLSIATDWDKLDAVTKVRNEVEHYYTTVTRKSLEALIVNAFTIVRNFITTELKEDPRLLLGEEMWQFLLELEEVHQLERAACELAFEKIDWQSTVLEEGVAALVCEACGADVLLPDAAGCSYRELRLDCRACGASYDMDQFVPAAVKAALDGDAYVAATDGGETPYVDCPECSAPAYVIGEGRCLVCDHEAEHTCIRCGNWILAEELDTSPLCGYCHHVSTKDD